MKPRYEITICDGDECKVIDSTKNPELAERKAVRALRKRAKKLKSGKKRGRVYAAVYRKDNGVVDTNPIYEAEERYGEPKRRGGRRRAKPVEEAVAEPVEE